MRGNNVIGLIFTNLHGELISELTDKRTMGSVPFGGKYGKFRNQQGWCYYKE